MKNTILQQQIALSMIPGFGCRRIRKLISQLDTVEEFFTMSKRELSHLQGINKTFVQQLDRQKALDAAAEYAHYFDSKKEEIFFFKDMDFPQKLNQCDDAPVLLFGKGKLSMNIHRMVAVVGTRNASDYGKKLCEELLLSFVGKNICVVSGLAYGIDIYVHELCLKYNIPTIGVLGHGLDRIYPAVHKKTAHQMLENGGLLSEFLPFTKPDRENFPMRNRIVAGMCDATIVIESGSKGGSLITAELANDYQRDVFAFPGDVTREFSKGCNSLIQRNKAHLICNSKEFFHLMNWDEKPKPVIQQRQLFVELSKEEDLIYNILKENKEIQIDLIAQKSKLPISKTSVALLNLEFMALVKSLPGQKFMLI